MSTLALMRWLEAAPSRYDRGMRWLTLGRASAMRHRLVEEAVQSGDAVLEIGCGTGALTAELLAAGARVTALDQNPEMLERARARIDGPPEPVACEWLERTASEIDGLPAAAFDCVAAAFSLSEMSADERRFVLAAARERLRPEGRIAICDETRPPGRLARLLYALLRAPQAALGWLLIGSVSRPLADLEDELLAAGFRVTHRTRWLAGQLSLVIAEPAP
jgi:demethylmenaquinone methyltransferase/2-methoxy-6-polyprenyl-1,4-benzoquinol methylase